MWAVISVSVALIQTPLTHAAKPGIRCHVHGYITANQLEHGTNWTLAADEVLFGSVKFSFMFCRIQQDSNAGNSQAAEVERFQNTLPVITATC